MTPRYEVGESVAILRACRLPIEDVQRRDVIARITTASDGTPLYWLQGGGVAQTERTLRAYEELDPAIYFRRHAMPLLPGPYGVSGGCDHCEPGEGSWDDAIAARVARQEAAEAARELK